MRFYFSFNLFYNRDIGYSINDVDKTRAAKVFIEILPGMNGGFI